MHLADFTFNKAEQLMQTKKKQLINDLGLFFSSKQHNLKA